MNEEEKSDWLSSVHWVTNRSLWAFGIILPIFMVWNMPTLLATKQQAETEFAMGIASENRRFCEKWGLIAGSAEHLICVRDLIGIRADTEQHLRDEAADAF
jgi:hypothetical protein